MLCRVADNSRVLFIAPIDSVPGDRPVTRIGRRAYALVGFGSLRGTVANALVSATYRRNLAYWLRLCGLEPCFIPNRNYPLRFKVTHRKLHVGLRAYPDLTAG